MYDYLIIGQGLAGTLIGYRLEIAGKTVFYLDHSSQTSASSVAAGIINPITGRRFVKSWRIDELLPVAKGLYAELEAELGIKFWYDLPLVRTLFNRGELNQWDVRGDTTGYGDYTEDKPDLGHYANFTQPAFAYAGIRQTARVDIGKLVTAYRERLKSAGHFQAIDTEIDLQKIADGYQFSARVKAREIIYAEGWRAKFNPYFSYLPFGGAKGEVLHVRFAEPPAQKMLKHRIFLVPQADGTYWVGATAENRFETDAPTSANANYLEERLKELVTVPYEILDHRAAVRPTVKDRRPFLGRHPEAPDRIIFNGLGTKGASLAPLCSEWLARHLLAGEALPKEVDIARFDGGFGRPVKLV